MNLFEFQSAMAETYETARNDIDIMEAAMNALPELPENCHYHKVSAFPVPFFARTMIEMQCDTRQQAAEIIKRFQPKGMIFVKDEAPHFRPAAISEHVPSYEVIAPICFTTYAIYQEAALKFASQLVWYIEPLPLLQAPFIMNLRIFQDESCLLPDGAENMPDGNLIIDGAMIGGMKTASVYWNEFSENWTLEDWAASFGAPKEEWSEVFE